MTCNAAKAALYLPVTSMKLTVGELIPRISKFCLELLNKFHDPFSKSVTLNDLERRNSRYIALFQ